MANSVVFNDYMPQIWNSLMAVFQNEIGVAGIMGNLYAESGCTAYACQPSRPYNTCMTYIGNVDTGVVTQQEFVNYGCAADGGTTDYSLGFGLAQWTYYSRKQNLYTYMFNHGNSIGNLTNQIAFLISEMQSDYSAVYNHVLNATNIDDITDYIMVHYEAPSDQSEGAKSKRRQWATEIYNRYAGTVPIEPVNPQPPSPDTPIPVSKNDAQKQLALSSMPLWLMLKNMTLKSKRKERDNG